MTGYVYVLGSQSSHGYRTYVRWTLDLDRRLAEHNSGKRHRATCTGHGRAHRVNRFTREDAECLAQACDARAVFWRDAAVAEAATLRGHIATLEAASAA